MPWNRALDLLHELAQRSSGISSPHTNNLQQNIPPDPPADKS
jgi:hypothetical protein